MFNRKPLSGSNKREKARGEEEHALGKKVEGQVSVVGCCENEFEEEKLLWW